MKIPKKRKKAGGREALVAPGSLHIEAVTVGRLVATADLTVSKDAIASRRAVQWSANSSVKLMSHRLASRLYFFRRQRAG